MNIQGNQYRFVLLLTTLYLQIKKQNCTKKQVLDLIEEMEWIKISDEAKKIRTKRYEVIWRHNLSGIKQRLSNAGYLISLRYNRWAATPSGITELINLYDYLCDYFTAQLSFFEDANWIKSIITPKALDTAKELLTGHFETDEHKTFREEILKPFPFSKSGDKTVFAKIIDAPHDIDNPCTIHISLLNLDMLKYDSLIFNQDALFKKDAPYYRPYFYEYYIDSKKCGQELLWQLIKNEGRWLQATFDADTHDNGMVLDGIVIFGASPVMHEHRTLVITASDVPHDINNRIKYCYDTEYTATVVPAKHIEAELNEITKHPLSKLNILNVGQGNCCELEFDNSSILFDIGYNRHPNSPDWAAPRIRSSQIYINMMRPNMVILSHWDMDHIMGVNFADDSLFSVTWIAPNIEPIKDSISLGASRLAKYLSIKNNLFFTDVNQLDTKIFGNTMSNFQIWQGKGKNNIRNKGLNLANNIGLIIVLIDKDKYLIAGDCEYDMLPDKISLNNIYYDYLVVPHHGSEMPLPRMPKKNPRFNKCFAIISAGDNSYKPKHPDSVHTDYLKNALGYELMYTKDYTIIELP